MKIRQFFSKVLLITVLLGSLAFAGIAEAKVKVKGYTKKSGTYVQPHYRSSPNTKKYDNWSTKGNYNPYTGKKGYKSPFKW